MLFMVLNVQQCPLWPQTCCDTSRSPRYRCCAQVSNSEPPTISHPYPQLINQHLVCFFILLTKFWRFFTCRQFQPYRSVVLFVSSSSLRDFSLIKLSVFPPHFFIKFRRFFHQLNTYGFLLVFSLSLGGFFYQVMISNTYTFVGTCVQEERQL